MFMFITQIIAMIFCSAMLAVIINKIIKKIEFRPIIETDEGPHLYITKEL